jgi:pimeloyl-ACP methyl ester carboxylesterase
MSDLVSESSGINLPLHGFLGENHPFFVSYHQPTAPSLDAAYVICPPLGYEAIQSYAAMRVLAEDLARAGVPVARIDYPGTGESGGSDLDPGRVLAWVTAVSEAAGVLRSMDGVDSVGLIGLRVGGLLAARVATEIEVSGLVLWEACASGAMYSRELEIMGSASMGALAGPSTDGEQESPFAVEAGGYGLTGETVASLRELVLDEMQLASGTDVLLLGRDDRPPSTKVERHLLGRGCRVDAVQVTGFKEMMVAPAASRVPREMLDTVIDWVCERGRRTSGEFTLPLRPFRVENGVVHRPCRFGPEGRLFGVVSALEPASEPTDSRDELEAGSEASEGGMDRRARFAPDRVESVVILSGGVVPRTAVNGMYVPLAQRLALGGRTVLRVDVSGICESPPEAGAPPNDAYASALVADARSAVDVLGDGPVWFIGLCSGAYAAFAESLDDTRVVGEVLINPLVFHWEEGMSLDSPSVQQLLAASAGPGSSGSARWKRLFSGEVDIASAIGVRLSALRSRSRSASRWLGQWLGAPSRGLPAQLQGLLDRHTTVALAFSEGDPGHRALLAQIGGREKGLLSRGLVIEVFPGADHTFSALDPRARLLDWVATQIEPTMP